METNAKVLCLGSPKEASLYFDAILPFDFANCLIFDDDPINFDSNCIPFRNKSFDRDILKSLLLTEDGVKSYYEHLPLMIVTGTINHAKRNESYASDILSKPLFLKNMSDMFQMVGVDADSVFRSIINGTLNQREIDKKTEKFFEKIVGKAGYLHSPLWIGEVRGHKVEKDYSSNNPINYAALSSLSLVDIKNVSWDAVVEFRKDKESRAALRDLRLFFSRNFENASQDYIVDVLGSAIHKQEQTAKIWGFSTTQRCLAVALSDKSLISTAVGGLAIAGTGLSFTAAAAAAAVITLGNCTLEFGKAIIDRHAAELDRPTRYLTDIKKLNGK